MLIGYARVSTDDQNLDLQIDALKKAGVEEENIFHEHVSGAKTHRPALQECMKMLRRGDTLIVWRLDRLGRRLKELCALVDEFHQRGIEFQSLNESINTTTATGRLIFSIFGAFAEFERNLTSERTKAGLKAARARGARGGRPPTMDSKQVAAARSMLRDGTVTHGDVARVFNVSESTLSRTLKRAEEDEEFREQLEELTARRKAIEKKKKEARALTKVA